MAPVKVPKKPLKSMEKPLLEKPISKSKKMRRKNFQSFQIYIFKLLKTVSEYNIGISRKSMMIMDNFVNDMLEKIASEASRLVAHGKGTTLTSREIQTAVKLLMPGELAQHANAEGLKAIILYRKSKEHDTAA